MTGGYCCGLNEKCPSAGLCSSSLPNKLD
jgi:hypothetical protein